MQSYFVVGCSSSSASVKTSVSQLTVDSMSLLHSQLTHSSNSMLYLLQTSGQLHVHIRPNKLVCAITYRQLIDHKFCVELEIYFTIFISTHTCRNSWSAQTCTVYTHVHGTVHSDHEGAYSFTKSTYLLWLAPTYTPFDVKTTGGHHAIQDIWKNTHTHYHKYAKYFDNLMKYTTQYKL